MCSAHGRRKALLTSEFSRLHGGNPACFIILALIVKLLQCSEITQRRSSRHTVIQNKWSCSSTVQSAYFIRAAHSDTLEERRRQVLISHFCSTVDTTTILFYFIIYFLLHNPPLWLLRLHFLLCLGHPMMRHNQHAQWIFKKDP